MPDTGTESMTLTEKMQTELTKVGVPSTRRFSEEGYPFVEISDEVSVEVMPEMVELGGRPYMVLHPGSASPTLATPSDVVEYLRREGLL